MSCLSRNHHGVILIIAPRSCLARRSCLLLSKSPLLHFCHQLLLIKYGHKEIWVILPKRYRLKFLSNLVSLNTFILGYLFLRMRSIHILVYFTNFVMCTPGRPLLLWVKLKSFSKLGSSIPSPLQSGCQILSS